MFPPELLNKAPILSANGLSAADLSKWDVWCLSVPPVSVSVKSERTRLETAAL